MTDSPLIGTVLAAQANYYQVRLETHSVDVPDVEELLCTRRSRLKKMGQQVMVGDRVEVEEPDWMGQRGAIAQVLPRQTELVRPPVANVDQMLLVFALADPPLDPQQLTRFLITAESTGLEVRLGLSKCDLVTPEQQAEWTGRLQQWGYTPTLLSLVSNQGLDTLRTQLTDRTTVVSGPSGVGKSSLISSLIPAAELRVGAVSERWGRGKHTTRHVELFELPGGGLLADTPGFNQPSLECQPEHLIDYFPEARQRLEVGACQFHNCLHRHEPNCVVRGEWERYPYYLALLEEAIAYSSDRTNSSDAESTAKLKYNQQGEAYYEPKLRTKRYRRPSRRTQQQTLQSLYEEDLLES